MMLDKIIEQLIENINSLDIVQKVKYNPETNAITIEFTYHDENNESIKTYEINLTITNSTLIKETKLEFPNDIDISVDEIEESVGYTLTDDEKTYVKNVVEYIKRSKNIDLTILVLENNMFDAARLGDNRTYTILKEIIRLLEN